MPRSICPTISFGVGDADRAVLVGLVDEFGKERVLDTPISEPGFTGLDLRGQRRLLARLVQRIGSLGRRLWACRGT